MTGIAGFVRGHPGHCLRKQWSSLQYRATVYSSGYSGGIEDKVKLIECGLTDEKRTAS